jgi:hypothetical protein
MSSDDFQYFASNWLAGLEKLVSNDVHHAEAIMCQPEPKKPTNADRVWAGRYLVKEMHTELIDALQQYRAALNLISASRQQSISAAVYRLLLSSQQIHRYGELSPAVEIAFEEARARRMRDARTRKPKSARDIIIDQKIAEADQEPRQAGRRSSA